MTAPVPMSRRTFLAGAAALGLGAVACSRGGLSTAPPGNVGSSTGRLRVLNWGEYIDAETVDRFSAVTGTNVDYVEDYNDNIYGREQVFGPTLERGKPTGYDVIVPTYWLVAELLSEGLLNELPLERIPNHVNLEPALLGTAWDQGARYQLPWQAGFTGIAYNPALTRRDITSFSDLLDPALKGRVGMVSEMREVLGFFMLANGEDPSRATLASADAALDRMEQVVASGQVAQFTGDEHIDLLKSGQFAASLAWSGGVLQLQADRPDLRFVIPAEGGMRWFDSMIIPRGASNVAAAGDWMNFVYDPVNAARITAAVQYVSPVLGVKEELARMGGDEAKLAASPILFPDDATRRKLYFWSGTTPAEEADLQARFSRLTNT
ncbi:MAG: ABC transporter substrate-binding protein [Acidimicrobiales bacterium]